MLGKHSIDDDRVSTGVEVSGAEGATGKNRHLEHVEERLIHPIEPDVDVGVAGGTAVWRLRTVAPVDFDNRPRLRSGQHRRKGQPGAAELGHQTS